MTKDFQEWKLEIVSELYEMRVEFPESAEYLYELGYSVNQAIDEVLLDGTINIL